MPRVQKKLPVKLWLTFSGLICKGNSRFWHSLLWTLGTNGLKTSVLAPCNIRFLKTINWIEVQKYLFGINGLNSDGEFLIFIVGRAWEAKCRSGFPSAYLETLAAKDSAGWAL